MDSFVELMKTLNQSFREFVERERLFTKADKLLLACSGGLDSTVLAHLLKEEGYDFAIAHMNFQLRGEASDGDAAFVEELARTLDAKFYYKAVDVKAEARSGESTQMVARRLRYDWFEKILEEYDCDSLLTAHHAQDNLETVLINLIRGTGIHGVAGMLPKRGHLCRPLLNTDQGLLKTYAAAGGIRWREDASNASDDYLRNRVRHQLAPKLFELGMSVDGWVTTTEQLRSAASFYNLGIASVHRERCESRQSLWIVQRSGWGKQELQTFLHEQVHVYGFTREQIRQMVSLAGQRTLETDSTTVYITPEQLVFELKSSANNRQPEPVEIRELPATGHPYAYFKVELSTVPTPEFLDQPNTLYLAPPTFPLHLRPRKNGDRFQPLGLGGKTKKVKDYMIDQKIPVWQRDRIYLLVNDEDEIMAIPGYCISENFKVLPEHKKVLRIRWK